MIHIFSGLVEKKKSAHAEELTTLPEIFIEFN